MKSVLKILRENSILATDLTDDMTKLNVQEACDFFYHINLSKESVKRLGEEFIEISEKMK